MKRLILSLISALLCAAAFANQGPYYAAQDDVDVIIGPIFVYTADATGESAVDFNTTGLNITCSSPQSATLWEWNQGDAEIDDEASHTVHGSPAAGQIGLERAANGDIFLHFVDDLWSVTDWKNYGCKLEDGGTVLMATDFQILRLETAADIATDVRVEMDANSTHANDALVGNHLDHIFQTAYDAATPPGVADALFNELVEDDTGVARFTANALEQGPTGGGDSASVIADAVWEEAIADHSGTVGSTAEALSDAAAGGGGGGGGTVDLTAQAIADIWAHVLEPNGNITAKCAMAIQLAALSGEFLQTGGSVTIEDHTGTTTRVTATVTSNGRNGVTYTCP